MKRVVLTMLILLSISYSGENKNLQLECQSKLKEIEKTLFSALPIPAIGEVDLAHQFSSVSSSNGGLDFLDYDVSHCNPTNREAIRYYWSIVSLFSINDGNIFINPERVNEYESDVEEFSIEKPFIPTDNERFTKNHIKKILKFYDSDIKDYNIKVLGNKIQELRNSFRDDTKENIGLNLSIVSSRLESLIKKIKKSEDSARERRKSPAIFLSKIMETKQFYNNHSWLAMNFYNNQKEKIINDRGLILETPLNYVESELITNDMNGTKGKYQYYLLKDGKYNKDINQSSKYHYFLAEDGKQNPMMEMKATLHYFFDNPQKTQNRVCKDYQNRYVLLKQLFKGNESFSEAIKGVKCKDLAKNTKFSYGYFTTGKNTGESFGHSILHAERQGEYRRKTDIPLKQKDTNSSTLTNIEEFYINFGVDTPETGFFNKIKYNINGMVGNINGYFKVQKQVQISNDYRDRMLVKFPIIALEKDLNKKELFTAQIEHLRKNINKFSMPYKFMSKNCAYALGNLLEVPFPDLRNKFNDNSYFSFSPKDVIRLMKGKIDVTGHKAIRF